MEQKNIVATIYLKNGKAVKSRTDMTEVLDVYKLCRLYNDSGIDKIIVLDLSDTEIEQKVNLQTIKQINRNLDIKVCAGGNINRIDDVQNLIYAGCMQVILNGAKLNTVGLAAEASKKFGTDRILVSVNNVDFLFKYHSDLEETIHELYVMNIDIMESVENITSVPYVLLLENYDFDKIVSILKKETIRGISGPFINDVDFDIYNLKSMLSREGIKMDNFAPSLKWSDLKLNCDGMVPVIVQDYRTDEVLMLAYMNEEAFNTTINIGKMTYWSRSRNELWTKGLTSGHVQYVKSLTADCDYDTILAKVSQVGAACHTGSRTCFFNSIVQKQYVEKNPLKVLEEVYKTIADRKYEPQVSSYTNYLLDQGIDHVLKNLGEECIEIVIAAKNPDSEELKYEITDFLYNCMVLMVEKGVTWEDITNELAQR